MLFEIFKGNVLVLNPGAEYGKDFIPEESEKILNGSIWKPGSAAVIQEITEVMVGIPGRYPHKLADALGRCFKTMPEVECDYLAHYFNPADGEKAHALIGIEVSAQWEKVEESVGMIMNSVIIPDPPIDLIQVKSEEKRIATFLFGSLKPFYRKKMKLFYLFKEDLNSDCAHAGKLKRSLTLLECHTQLLE